MDVSVNPCINITRGDSVNPAVRSEEDEGLESAWPHSLTSGLGSGHNGVKSTPDHLLYKERFRKIKDFITLPVS